MKQYKITFENINTKEIGSANISLTKIEYEHFFNCLINKTIIVGNYIIKSISFKGTFECNFSTGLNAIKYHLMNF